MKLQEKWYMMSSISIAAETLFHQQNGRKLQRKSSFPQNRKIGWIENSAVLFGAGKT